MEPALPTSKYLRLTGHLILLVLVMAWMRTLFSQFPPSSEPPWIFLDYANLIFHEAGHILFLFFGDFLHVLGGSLTECVLPLLILGAFIRETNYYAASFALFWFGDASLNTSYYIADARARALPLLGGDPSGHDWHWLLSYTHLLNEDIIFGRALYILGAFAVVLGFAGMVYFAYTSFRNSAT